jgi:ABC-2 type transport system ATP-binding protein
MLGPNGAGKTTTVNVLTTLLKADAGTVRVAGHDAATETKKVRAAIGVTGQFAAVDELLTGKENLRLMADLKRARSGDQVVSGLLERFDLTESADKLASTYSGGMRRKLDLAMTLVGSPRIIFLDEPTTGLDPRSRRTMHEIVRELVADGTTIFLTTQYLEEADRIAVLDQGRLVAQGTPRSSSARFPARTSGSGSPTSANSTRRRASWTGPRETTRSSPCGCPATASRNRCGPCWTGSTST